MSVLHCGHRFPFIVWICLEILIIVIFVIYATSVVSQGANLSNEDILFIAITIGTCCVAIVITVICNLVLRKHIEKEDETWMSFVCCHDNVHSKLKLVNRDLSGSACAICLEEKTTNRRVVEISCRHTYHRSCITQLLKTETTARCPQCRSHPEVFSFSERFAALIGPVNYSKRTVA